jgi:hypothetical protein
VNFGGSGFVSIRFYSPSFVIFFFGAKKERKKERKKEKVLALREIFSLQSC